MTLPSREPQSRDSGGRRDPSPGNHRLFRPELRITAIYILLASLWIIGSDAVLNHTVDGDAQTVALHTCKGLNFVFTTGLLLFFVLRRAYGGWRHAEAERLAAVQAGRDRFRNLSKRILNLREEERAAISREIHDELGQALTGIKMQLRLLEDQLGDRDDRSLNSFIDELVQASASIDETIAAVQRISSGLRPLALDHLGLAAAINEEAAQFSRRTGIETRITMEGMDRPIPPAVETAAFRIFQESLTNAARHAEAGRIDIACTLRDHLLDLTIRDDGMGMAPSVIDNPASLGLAGMLERAADAGGNLDFESTEGGGTTVHLTIPLTGGQSPPTTPDP